MSAVQGDVTQARASTPFESIMVRSADGSTEARFVPGANMVCCSLRYRGLEFLHLGGGVDAYAKRGATMGIPLLHPWANRLAGFQYTVAGRRVVLPEDDRVIPVDDAGLPIHGVLPGLLHWDVRQWEPEALVARLAWSSPELLAPFPFPHELTLHAIVTSGALTITTTLRPTSDQGVPVSFGFHPYLRIPGVPRQGWQIALGAVRHLALDGWLIPTGEHEPANRRHFCLEQLSFDDAFDRLLVPAEFKATAKNGAVTMEFLDGFPYAQLYAPAGSDFICFEPMTAPTNALRSGDGLQIAAPGKPYRARFAISVSDPCVRSGPSQSPEAELV